MEEPIYAFHDVYFKDNISTISFPKHVFWNSWANYSYNDAVFDINVFVMDMVLKIGIDKYEIV